ncbi:HEAT repeat domain-containing protein [Arsenicibacter rosenii]|uniref:Anti-sigma factor n=1 Tax=Arsenicibacter rosenii TaxID=1750698 RepID=A0A1S2VL52_9BACT|nr:HEAT repeat domain-containing protein [Arsenicibacter rosenii]OIN58955.1 anti-sigma factor [Arsenicibacter rosenii]
MNHQDIDALLARYYEGETTLEEEQWLKQYFASGQQTPQQIPDAGLFRYADGARAEHPSPGFSTRVTARLNKNDVIHRIGGWSMRIAAGLALLLLGFAAGRYYTGSPNETVAENGQTAEIKNVLSVTQQANTSASDRILAVNQCTELPQVNEDITQLLINTMNADDNVNVRLAACQALVSFENEPGVREALIQSLKSQTDANVQITLIELLVAIKEKRAMNAMQQLAQSKQTIDVVRQKAEEGVSRLSRQTMNSAS